MARWSAVSGLLVVGCFVIRPDKFNLENCILFVNTSINLYPKLLKIGSLLHHLRIHIIPDGLIQVTLKHGKFVL